MADETITIRRLSAGEAREAVPALASILIDCVENGASVSFMAPLAREKAENFWGGIAESVGRGERILLAAEESASGTLVGTAQAVFAQPENQPHRADISKVLVLSRARRQGVGAALMRAVEREALAAGKTLLALDTTTGAAGERLYERLGWIRLGIMPGHALMPDGRMSDTTFFYKQIGGTQTTDLRVPASAVERNADSEVRGPRANR